MLRGACARQEPDHAVLVVKDLCKTYATGEVALRNVGLALGEEEFVAIIGRSGAGKSTLLRCINRLVEPDSGSVVVKGTEITRMGKSELALARRDIGMIFQEFNLVDRLVVLENVLSGRLGATSTWRSFLRAFKPDDIDRALDICERVGILEHVEKRADQLSGGQRQRVGIARALMQRPKLLLADEPVSSLDPKTGREIMDLIRRIATEEKVPVLVSLHDVGLARDYAHRIVGLRRGEKVVDLPIRELSDATVERVYSATA